MGQSRTKSFALEFLSIFIAVVAAFALNNWNDNRKAKNAAQKILFEISEGLDKDIEDLDLNVMGHQSGIQSCKFWRDLLLDIPRSQDSIELYSRNVTRDFVNIQNTSGYETLQSKGLELIKDDSLRTQIISLYEFDYAVLRKLEEEYSEMQFSASYYKDFIRILSPFMDFDHQGRVVGIDPKIDIAESDRKLLFAYLGKIESNRRFILHYYGIVRAKILDVDRSIELKIN